MTVTMTRLQYEADLQEAYQRGVENSQKDAQQAYEQGRADERQHLREVATRKRSSTRAAQLEGYLTARGWKVSANKVNGVEWVDRSDFTRIGVPNRLTPKSWAVIMRSLAAYYGGSPENIATEVLSYRR